LLVSVRTRRGLQSEESQKVGWLQSYVREGNRGHKKKMARFLTGLFTIFSGLEAWVTDYWGAGEGVTLIPDARLKIRGTYRPIL
jgi:hypothetical protein